jgi:hypothetical protein
MINTFTLTALPSGGSGSSATRSHKVGSMSKARLPRLSRYGGQKTKEAAIQSLPTSLRLLSPLLHCLLLVEAVRQQVVIGSEA